MINRKQLIKSLVDNDDETLEDLKFSDYLNLQEDEYINIKNRAKKLTQLMNVNEKDKIEKIFIEFINYFIDDNLIIMQVDDFLPNNLFTFMIRSKNNNYYAISGENPAKCLNNKNKYCDLIIFKELNEGEFTAIDIFPYLLNQPNIISNIKIYIEY